MSTTQHEVTQTATAEAEEKALQVVAQLKLLQPEMYWATFPLCDYDRWAEIDAPEVLVCFGRTADEAEEGYADPYATNEEQPCEPSHWGVSAEAAQIVQAFNRIFVTKYPEGNGPKLLAWEASQPSPKEQQPQTPNWRVDFHDNDGNAASVDVHADRYDDAISLAAKRVRNMYFKSANLISELDGLAQNPPS